MKSDGSGDKAMKSNLHAPGRFATTHWSVVRAAAAPDATDCTKALETLCQTYWFPLYAYLRRQGHNSDSAEEYTQAFFAQLLDKKGLRLADPKKGKFRSFLLAALKHFLANQRKRARARKRGGGRKIFPLDFQNAETQFTMEPADHLSPEKLFERAWALTILERTMERLRNESATAGKQGLFDSLKIYLTTDKAAVPYKQVAQKLQMSQPAVRVAVHRLKRRYRDILRSEIADTVTTEKEIDQEIRDLFAALAT
jgi:RNA polymerase sigma factor (sigma-70 family)